MSFEEQLDDSNLITSPLTFRTYSYRENIFAEFEGLIGEGKKFDGLIIDLMQTGFSLPMEMIVKFFNYGKRLLKPEGVMLFVKPDGAITLTKDDPGGGLTLNIYDSPFGIFTRYPMLADYLCATVSGVDRRRLRGGGSTLANHILYTSIPVLTSKGTELKNRFEIPPPQNWLLQLIDDYSSCEAIARLMEARHHVHSDETFALLQELESEGIIFPIFARIQFLANCYHNHKPFRLGRYMVASSIITPSQLEELLEMQQEEGWGRNQKTFLGLLAIRRGYINTRELELLLNDQYLYGGYHKAAEADEMRAEKKRSIETVRDSMIGSLGAIDSAGLLQSISTAKKTGLLTIENRDKTIIVLFSEGKPTHARLGKLSGMEAVTEYLVTWNEGIFVFRDKGMSPEITADCLLNQSLDRMLLDGALYQDQVNTILAQIPEGRNAVLERVWNFDELWIEFSQKDLHYFDETIVAEKEKAKIYQVAKKIDGLTIIDEVINSTDDWTTNKILKSIQLMLDNKLIVSQQTSLFRPLTLFQRVSGEIQALIGKEENKNLLLVSSHYVHGESAAARRFNIDVEGRISVNLNEVKNSGTPVSVVLLELRRWMEAYLAYVRRQVDPQIVDALLSRVVKGGND
jgi:hypothetical protein